MLKKFTQTIFIVFFLMLASNFVASAQQPVLVITNPAPVCQPGTVDITDAAITAGSTLPAGTILNYFADAATTLVIPAPNVISTSGRYYIKATSPGGFTDIVSVEVTINPTPILTITNPAAADSSSTVDITAAAITAGSTLPAGTTLSYYFDAFATIAIASPSSIIVSGTYYIKAITTSGCMAISPVTVKINTPQPILVIQNPDAVCAPNTVDITNPAIVDHSILPAGTVLSYYIDPATSQPLANPAAVAVSGTYYIKATPPSGSSATAPLAVTIFPTPSTPIVSNISFCQGTMALPLTATSDPGSTLLWYQTQTGGVRTSLAPTPSTTIADITVYYVAQISSNGCESPTRAVLTVTTNPIPILTINNPAPVCSPSVVDIAAPAVVTFSPANTVLSYYSDANATTTLASPTAIATGGTYYIEATTPLGCSTINPVVVSVSNNCKTAEPVSVYPDPANQTLTISFNPNETGDGYFELINDKGQAVIKMSIIFSSSIPINVSSMPKGEYYYVIRNSNGQKLKTGKVIIIH